MNATMTDELDALADDGPESGPAAEVITWAGDLLACVNAAKAMPRLVKMPEGCAGDADDEATVLGGVVLGLGIDPSDPRGVAKFLSDLKRDVERATRQTLADIESAAKQALSRLEILSRDAGEFVSPAILKVHAERDINAGREGLLDVAELPEGHRLKNLLPSAELVRGRWLCLGVFRQSLTGQSMPPGLISIAAIKQRTKLAARKAIDGSFGL